MDSFRFGTFNIHHGKHPHRPYSNAEMVASIESLNADVLCVQELDVFALRTRITNQPKKIAKSLGYDFVTCQIRYFGAGFQNNAVFSRFPIVSSKDFDLPRQSGQQLRKAVIADIDFAGKTIAVTSTHLHAKKHGPKNNVWAAKQLAYLLGSQTQTDVCLIGADLNMVKDEVAPLIDEYGFVAPSGHLTSPAHNPTQQIDWIAAKNLVLKDLEVSEQLCSDHRALLATVSL